MSTYDFASYLAQVPTYRRKDDATLQQRADTSANLIFDPQRAEIERQRQWQEAQHINNMQKLKASQAGVEETLAYNEAKAKKANAIRAAASGAIGSSGLNDYLNNEIDKALQGQRLNIAATLAANRDAEIGNYLLTDKQSLGKLSEIERLRGQTKSSLFQDLLANEDARQTAWDANALQVALGIGSGELQARDLAFRKQNAKDQIELQRYLAELPYNNMTKYQQATEDRLTKEMMGGIPADPNTATGLRSYIEKHGGYVDWDEKTGNVNVNGTIYTPDQLGQIGKLVNGRWVLPLSKVQQMMIMK